MLKSARIDYSQMLLDKLISIKGFRLDRISDERANKSQTIHSKQFTIKCKNYERQIPDVETRPFFYLSVNQLIYLHYMTVTLESNNFIHMLLGRRERERNIYNRDTIMR